MAEFDPIREPSPDPRRRGTGGITIQWSGSDSIGGPVIRTSAWPFIATGGSGSQGSECDDRYPRWVSALILIGMSAIFWIGLFTLVRWVFPF